MRGRWRVPSLQHEAAVAVADRGGDHAPVREARLVLRHVGLLPKAQRLRREQRNSRHYAAGGPENSIMFLPGKRRSRIDCYTINIALDMPIAKPRTRMTSTVADAWCAAR